MDVYLETYDGISNCACEEGTCAWMASPTNAYHQHIKVDLWDDDGKHIGTKSFSFKQTTLFNVPSWGKVDWFGKDLGWNYAGTTNTGIVYHDKAEPQNYKIEMQKTTTKEEDRRVLAHLEALVGTEHIYSYFNLNCRGFSFLQFEQVKGKLVKK